MDVIFGNLDLWGRALGNTLLVFAFGGVIALVLGLVVGAMRVSPVPIARAVGTVYVNIIRNTPLTLVFFFFVFGYPVLGLPRLSNTVLGILAIGIYTATYVAETLPLRAGDEPHRAAAGVPHGRAAHDERVHRAPQEHHRRRRLLDRRAGRPACHHQRLA